MQIIDDIQASHAEFTALRRDIHAHPELGFEETRTSTLVANKLREWGYEVTTGLGKTGVVGTLKRGNSPRSIGIRADMDALPCRGHIPRIGEPPGRHRPAACRPWPATPSVSPDSSDTILPT